MARLAVVIAFLAVIALTVAQ
ncbi:unnamed protein product, partial [Allacma fusca]